MAEVYHIPAMLKETIEGLNIKPEGVYVDVTFGGGGHSRAILSALDNSKIQKFKDSKIDGLKIDELKIKDLKAKNQ